MVQLRTLGEVDLRTPGEQVRPTSLLDHPKRLAVFIFIAAEPGHVIQRDTLLALFWPESPPDRAKNALRQSLHVIRQALGTDVLKCRRSGTVRVNPERVSSDIASFHAALRQSRLEDALDLYQGEFLPGFYLQGAPEFERWADQERERAKRLTIEAAIVLAGRLERTEEYGRALSYFRTARRLAPFNERIARRHIWLLAAAGNRAEALKEFQHFKRRLHEDLGVSPSTATADLGAKVLRWRARSI